MYADRLEAPTRRSIKERLNGDAIDVSGRRRQSTGKRQRQDNDKWEHDLYNDDEPEPLSKDRRIGAKDLRLKLQKKNVQQANESGNGSVPGVRDLREKLSGIVCQHQLNTDSPKPKPVFEGNKPVRESVIVEVPKPETKQVTTIVPRKKTKQKVESIDSFLLPLGLEKYSIIFQAEEVDMTALMHMTDGDLKAIGIPMGPRKKILLALESRV